MNASDLADLFGPPEELGASPCGGGPSRSLGTDCSALTIPDPLLPHAMYPYTSSLEQIDAKASDGDDTHHMKHAPATTLSEFSHPNHVSAPLHFAAPALYTSQADFTAMNSLANSTQGPKTISPLQTRFDTPFNSEPSFSTEAIINSGASSDFEPWATIIGEESPATKRRRSSMSVDINATSPTAAKSAHGPGRRRRSENLEPGSARAVYLERNRQAASKCRSKQKKQHEELVETARDMERKNKVLKAEVEFLKGDMRELMEIVGMHASCPDNRLQTYVQREADRLASGAAGDKARPVHQLPTPQNSVSPDKQ